MSTATTLASGKAVLIWRIASSAGPDAGPRKPVPRTASTTSGVGGPNGRGRVIENAHHVQMAGLELRFELARESQSVAAVVALAADDEDALFGDGKRSARRCIRQRAPQHAA